MLEIKTKFGTLYIEDEYNREEDERIKLYDSRKRYLDYFTVESIPADWSVGDFIQYVIKGIKRLKSYDELLDYLGLDSWSASERWQDILYDISLNGDETPRRKGDKWVDENGTELTEEYVLNNEWVIVIGSTYILLCE